jgi:CRISPR-associated protein Csh2
MLAFLEALLLFKAEAKQKQEGEGTEEVLENEESEELSEESSFSLNSEYEESEAPKESSKKSKKSKKSTEDKKGWQPKPEPKTLTGAVQFNMGEVKHKAQEIQIQGTSVFGSEEGKTQGTFTNYAALRYALIAFNGIANEHSAKLSRMSNNDFEFLLQALWNGVRSAANTRTKVGQVPRFLVTIEYKEGEEFQFGNLLDYIKLVATHTKSEEEWDSPKDYLLDLSCLLERLTQQKNRIESIRYECSPDLTFTVPALPKEWTSLGFDTVTS